MKKFSNKNKYFLVLYDDEELTKPEISTLIYLDKFSDKKNNIIFKFESAEDNDPKKVYHFHDDSIESVYTFEELVEELNKTIKRSAQVKNLTTKHTKSEQSSLS